MPVPPAGTAPGHGRWPGARRHRGRHRRRRRPGQGLRGHLVDLVRRRPVAHRHRPRSGGWCRRGRVLTLSVPNVLATRYAGADLAPIWSPEHKVVLERQLWIAVLKAQRDLGVDVPDDVVADYEAVVDKVDLASIAARERVTRHDVKARIEEFNALAGHEHIHKGMTSRDLTENVEQLQVRHRSAGPPADGGHPGAAGPARGRARAARDDRPLAQRGRPGDHARQAVRDGRRRDAGRARPARRPDRALSAARHQGPDGHLAGHARPARRLLGQAGRARAAGRHAPRLRGSPHQCRPGLPALARLRRRLGAGPGRGRPLQPGHHDPADGRASSW